MRKVKMIGLLLFPCLALAVAVQGQEANQTPAQPPAQQAAPTPTISGVVDREVSAVEQDVVAAAEAMPADKYDFSPRSLNIPGSSYDNVRTFGGLVKHLATANYVIWSGIAGEKPPASITGPNGPDSMKSKADIVEFLKDSFALGHRAAKAVTSDNLLEPVQLLQRKAPLLYAMSLALWHSTDMYGQIVEYLRMNGIVPPASRTKE
jgi:hypothetical protein